MNNNIDVDEMPKWLSSLIGKKFHSNIIAGINEDDCAIIKVGKEEIVITTDYLNSNPIALELGIATYWDLGRILVAANISDLCGSCAYPKAFLASIMLDKQNIKESDYKDLMSGVKYELDKCKIPLIGGDSKLGKANSFCGIAIGSKKKNTKLLLKNGAKAGDSIWVSGKLGGTASATFGLQENNMPEDWNEWAKDKIINPSLPLKKSKKLARLKVGNGGTDISDGLGADLWNLCQASKVGALVEVDEIPLSKRTIQLAKKKNVNPWIFSLTIGGDFQFLFTANKKNDKKLLKLGFIRIGEILNEEEAYLIIQGKRVIMPKLGHRDSRKKTFYEEIDNLLNDITSRI